LGVDLLMFGVKKIPEVMLGLGSGIKEFKQAIKEDDEESKPSNTPVTLLQISTSKNSKEGIASESAEYKN
jgi:sec-independent protein translocase protein TatA